jgi:biotin transport system substrate-specific component
MPTVPASVAADRMNLSDYIWPQKTSGAIALARGGILVVSGSLLLTLSAKINVPLPYVPMTMQTLVVMMIGAAYGARLGVATVLAYLAQGAMGLPVFAGPIGGIGYMLGGTGGYLAGFPIAALLVAWLCERGWDRSVIRVAAAMTIGHIVVVGAGFAWLAFGLNLGVEKAWVVGVVPFIAGSIVKSLFGGFLLPAIWSTVDRKSGS